MTDATVPLEEIDLSSHDAFVERVPHDGSAPCATKTPCTSTPSPTAPASTP